MLQFTKTSNLSKEDAYLNLLNYTIGHKTLHTIGLEMMGRIMKFDNYAPAGYLNSNDPNTMIHNTATQAEPAHPASYRSKRSPLKR